MGKRKSSKEKERPPPPSMSQLESDFAASGMQDYLETHRTRVFCGSDSNTSAKYYGSSSSYVAAGVDSSQNLKQFEDALDIKVTKLDEESIEFELIGVSPSYANALRRILISEVPTMAIEHVFFLNNTSTIPDEILAHRLGLVPIAADPSAFEFRGGGEMEGWVRKDQKNTIVLGLKIACTKDSNTQEVKNAKVLSKQLIWKAGGSDIPDETNVRFTSSQEKNFPQAIRPVHDDILLAKLSLGQEIELEAHCTKGNGAEHAKWSPVATAWYRLCPEVVLLREVTGNDAEELMRQFKDAPETCPLALKGGKIVVKDERPHLECLERVRALQLEEKWSSSIQLRKRKDHFLFTVESTGAYSPAKLVREALSILKQKSNNISMFV